MIVMMAQPVTALEPPLAIQTFKNLDAGKQQTVIVYGTSLSALGAWAEQTKLWFDSTYPGKVKFINASGSGKDSGWAVKNLNKVVTQMPDLILIEFAVNDAKDSRIPLATAKANLDKIVSAIRAENPSTDIILQIMNIPWDAPNNNHSATLRPNLAQYNDNYRSYASEKNLPFIDHYSTWEKLFQTDPDKYQQWVPDGIHPSPEGSFAITWPAVMAFLERSRTASRE